VRIASRADVVIQMMHRPGHFPMQGHPQLDQAAMIERLATGSVDEDSDLTDVRRAYQAVLDADAAHAPLAHRYSRDLAWPTEHPGGSTTLVRQCR